MIVCLICEKHIDGPRFQATGICVHEHVQIIYGHPECMTDARCNVACFECLDIDCGYSRPRPPYYELHCCLSFQRDDDGCILADDPVRT